MAIRKDEIGFGGYVLYQDDEGFCYGVDAVLLADFSMTAASDRVIDLGTGTGIVPLIINAKYSPKEIIGVEKQRESYELALKNVRENHLEGQVSFMNLDVVDIMDHFPAESFDLVTTNPPYMEGGRGPVSPNRKKYDARTETSANLEDFISAASYLLKKGGRFCMVHRPSRLADIIDYSRKYKLEPKKLRMVAPHKGENANIVLVEMVKGGGKELTVLPELIVRTENGYTEEIERIYQRK